MPKLPIIQTRRTILKIPGPRSAASLLRFITENREHFARCAPEKPDEYYTLDYWKNQIRITRTKAYLGQNLCFIATDKTSRKICALACFGEISYGPFSSCLLAFCLDEKYQGKGLMQEILEACIDYLFSKLGIHRIVAKYMPENEKSSRLLARLGFEIEGCERSAIKIDGRWRDLIFTSRLNPSDSETVSELSQQGSLA